MCPCSRYGRKMSCGARQISHHYSGSKMGYETMSRLGLKRCSMTQDSEQEQFKDVRDVRCMENISQAMSDEEQLLPTSFHPTPTMFVSAWLTSHRAGEA